MLTSTNTTMRRAPHRTPGRVPAAAAPCFGLIVLAACAEPDATGPRHAAPAGAQALVTGSATDSVTALVLTQTTASAPTYAGTDDSYALIIARPGLPDCRVPIPGDTTRNEREAGRTDKYTIGVARCGLVRLGELTPGGLRMVSKGDNAWLPSRFIVVAKTAARSDTILKRSWPNTLWFSTDNAEFIPPHLSQAEWPLDVAGANVLGEPVVQVKPATVNVYYYHFISGPLTATSSCPTGVTLRGTLQNPNPAAISGDGSFGQWINMTGTPKSYGSSSYYCQATWQAQNLRAGSWVLTYTPDGQSAPAASCTKDLPLPSSRINFASDDGRARPECGTGEALPPYPLYF